MAPCLPYLQTRCPHCSCIDCLNITAMELAYCHMRWRGSKQCDRCNWGELKRSTCVSVFCNSWTSALAAWKLILITLSPCLESQVWFVRQAKTSFVFWLPFRTPDDVRNISGKHGKQSKPMGMNHGLVWHPSSCSKGVTCFPPLSPLMTSRWRSVWVSLNGWSHRSPIQCRTKLGEATKPPSCGSCPSLISITHCLFSSSRSFRVSRYTCQGWLIPILNKWTAIRFWVLQHLKDQSFALHKLEWTGWGLGRKAGPGWG